MFLLFLFLASVLSQHTPCNSELGSLCDAPPFKIIILAQRRPESLRRLLVSIEAADYENTKPHLEIRIDFSTDPKHLETIDLASQFIFQQGTSSVVIAKEKQGLQYAITTELVPC
jgi:hypothetical protein